MVLTNFTFCPNRKKNKIVPQQKPRSMPPALGFLHIICLINIPYISRFSVCQFLINRSILDCMEKLQNCIAHIYPESSPPPAWWGTPATSLLVQQQGDLQLERSKLRGKTLSQKQTSNQHCHTLVKKHFLSHQLLKILLMTTKCEMPANLPSFIYVNHLVW